MRRLYDFSKGDPVVICRLQTTSERQRLYASLGIFEGASLTVFLLCGKKLIVKVGTAKLALSKSAAGELFAKKDREMA